MQALFGERHHNTIKHAPNEAPREPTWTQTLFNKEPHTTQTQNEVERQANQLRTNSKSTTIQHTGQQGTHSEPNERAKPKRPSVPRLLSMKSHWGVERLGRSSWGCARRVRTPRVSTKSSPTSPRRCDCHVSTWCSKSRTVKQVFPTERDIQY